VYFETALNCVWLLLGATAIAGTVRAARRRGSESRRFSASLQLIGISAVVLALFPYISASDDVLRIASAAPQKSETGSRPSNGDTVRLYEVIDSAIVTSGCSFAVTLVFVCLVVSFTAEPRSRAVPFASGRSPPLPSSVSL
jgi:hypothetical protein